MNHRQYRACLTRLEAINGNAARRFEEQARETHALFARAGESQRMTWAIYHEYFPAREDQRQQEREERAVWR
jgi:hypothetical protein